MTEIRPIAWSIAAGFLAAWLAAGSTGVLVTSLQATLCWLLVGVAVFHARPQFTWRGWLMLAAVILLLVLVPGVVAQTRYGMVLTVAAVMAYLAAGLSGLARRLMWVASLAIVSLFVVRFGQQSLPIVWMLSDRFAGTLGVFVGGVVGRPLTIGASFAGLDVLLVMLVFCTGWIAQLRGPRWIPAVLAIASILATHVAYLVLLAFTPELMRALPLEEVPDLVNPYVPPPFSWSRILLQLLPWNLPWLAGVLQMIPLVLLIRTGEYAADRIRAASPGATTSARFPAAAPVALLLCLALILPLWGVWRSADGLDGKHIVAHPTGQVDWDVPRHDQYGRDSAGMYGVLAWLVESLGGELHVPEELDDAALASADALIVLHPDETMSPAEQDRIWRYVREGGSLLVVTEGFTAADGLARRVNELLRPTEIAVNHDAAVSAVTDWWGSLRAAEHAATTAVTHQTARCFSDAGASLQMRWPASPLVVGVWGWSAPEQGAAWSDHPYLHAGAKLGDLVMVAEQRVGAGRVIVLGDNTSLTNEGLVDGYTLVGPLLSYLAARDSGWFVASCRAVLALGLVAFLFLLVRVVSPVCVVVSCVLLTCSMAVGHSLSGEVRRALPDGSRIVSGESSGAKNRLAYIDATHLEPYSLQDWGFDALNGLALNLQRSGFLPLLLRDFSAARLERAGVLVSIGPARRFSRAEGERVRRFVEQGGTLISMVGAQEADASERLLADFQLHVPPSPVPATEIRPEPEPFGRTRADYLEIEDDDQGPYRASVRLFAAWPVESLDDEAEVIAYGRNTLPVVKSETELPVILERTFGQGRVILIGDTAFAMNKNLEYIGGQPFSGRYENAHFWRWWLARYQGDGAWVPPRPPQARATPDERAGTVDEEEEL